MDKGISTAPSRVRWGAVLASAVATAGCAVLCMAGVAALGLHLLGAEGHASLGPMTAAAVALAVGGQVTPSGDVSVLGMTGPAATGTLDVVPLGVGLAGAVPLAWLFLRGLRAADPAAGAGEPAARAACVTAVFTGLLGGLAWAGHDTVQVAATGGRSGLPSGLGVIAGLVDAKASVGYRTQVPASLGAAVVWVLAVLLIALLLGGRTPLPPGLAALRGAAGPAVAALCAVLLLAVVAGLVAAGLAAVTGDQPGRIVGGALLGAPNAVWAAVSIGMFLPWRGAATGPPARWLPGPLDRLPAGGVTVPRLAELNHGVWLLPVAIALTMLAAGVLAASRTPWRDGGRARFAASCAARLGAATALTLPLLVWLASVSVDAGVSVFGVSAPGAGLELHGSLTQAALLGAAWGAGAGAAGALLASATGAARRRPARCRGGAPGGPGGDSSRTYPEIAYRPGPYLPSPMYRPPGETNPYRQPVDGPDGRPAPAPRPQAGPVPAPGPVPPPSAAPGTAPRPAQPAGSGPAPHSAPTMPGTPLPPGRPPGRGARREAPPPDGPPPPGTPPRRP